MREWLLNDNNGIIYEDGCYDQICQIPSDSDVDIANAQLICAAPKLLAACKKLLSGITNPNSDAIDEIAEGEALAIAAIEAVKGVK